MEDVEEHVGGRHGIKEESPPTSESLREPPIARHSQEVDDALGPAAGVELSGEAEEALRAVSHRARARCTAWWYLKR